MVEFLRLFAPGYRPGVAGSVKTAVAGCLASLWALALLAWLVYEVDGFERIDARGLGRLSAHRYDSLGAAAGLVVHLGDPLPQVALLALACAIAVWRGKPRQAVAAAVLVAGANLTTQVLKVALAHPRYQPVLGYRQVGAEAFPSGHATAILAMALAFLLVVPRSWRPAVAVIGTCAVAGVGLSVVVLHRHYPSDVLGGLLVASAWFFGVEAVMHRGRRLGDEAASPDPARSRCGPVNRAPPCTK